MQSDASRSGSGAERASALDASSFRSIAARFPSLRIAVIGDHCLDRYLEIDPTISEISIETGLPVQNVVRVRPQPGGAGAIEANLCALRVGRIDAIGIRGDDGEGYELHRALDALPGLDTNALLCRPDRQTFTYMKPLYCLPGEPPRELSRLDRKNRSPTPADLQEQIARRVREIGESVDAMIVLDQVESPETGVVTALVRDAVAEIASRRRDLVVLADSRQGIGHFPSMGFKLNAAELRRTAGRSAASRSELAAQVCALARQHGHPVFVTLAEGGILGTRDGTRAHHVAAHPVTGPIDVVGAGDAVTATLTAAIAAGASIVEAMEISMAAASLVIAQLGTTGTATSEQITSRLEERATG